MSGSENTVNIATPPRRQPIAYPEKVYEKVETKTAMIIAANIRSQNTVGVSE